MEQFSSGLIEEAVTEFAKLPGIGRRGALRMVLHLIRQSKEDVEKFGNAMVNLRQNINYCSRCFNISDTSMCNICRSHKRDNTVVCVVEDIRDVIAVENTGQFTGLYHVLGGIISPMDGIGPNQLNIDQLIGRIEHENISEIIMALSTTMEGDTTVFYISKRLKAFDVKITTLARGVSIGGDLEYADELTLGRSIVNRIPYEQPLIK